VSISDEQNKDHFENENDRGTAFPYLKHLEVAVI